MRDLMTIGVRQWLAAACLMATSVGAVIAQEAVKKADGPKSAPAAVTSASIYDKAADANVLVAKASERAKHDNTRILLMFGGDWCGWCHKLHNLLNTNRDVAKVLYNEYVLVMVDLEAQNAAPLLKTCKEALSREELQRGIGYPFLAVLDADGNVVTAQRTDRLEEGDHHDPKKVLDFLNQWKVPPQDARRVVADALSRASAHDRRVLLTFGAPWCGWCHKLHDWLAQPQVAAILERDYLIAQVESDRMTDGPEVMKKYRLDTSGSIPWYVILDSQGKSLATADSPRGNIGYPFQPAEIDHFLGTVKDTARRIDGGQLDQLRKSLEENAEQIKKAMKR
jgi:thioredoxin-related protein